jgi:hypothetical protein
MPSVTRALASTFTLFALTAAARAADLFVGPGQAFADIQSAIDAASPGERVFVAPGVYETFEITKPVAVLGAGAGLVTVRNSSASSGTIVTGLPYGTEAVVAGMEFEGPGAFAGATAPARLVVRGNDGRVLVHDVRIAPTSRSPVLLEVTDCEQVVVSSCTLDGTHHDGASQIPIFVSDSALWVEGCELRAPLVGAVQSAGADPAIDSQNSTLVVQSSALFGGTAQPVFFAPANAFIGGEGGPAIRSYGGEVRTLGGTGNIFQGGTTWMLPAGQTYAFQPTGGNAVLSAPPNLFFPPLTCTVIEAADAVLASGIGPGFPQAPIEGPVVHVPESVARPTVAPLAPRVSIGTSSALGMTGAPSSPQWIFFALGSEHALVLPSLVGEVLVPPGAAVLLSGVATDVAGAASRPIQVPFVPALVGTLVWFQSVAPVPAGLAISAPSVLLIDA